MLIFIAKHHNNDNILHNSAHTSVAKDKVPYNVTKQVIVFMHFLIKMKYCLLKLREYLLDRKFTQHIIGEVCHDAVLQGPALLKDRNSIPIVTTYDRM